MARSKENTMVNENGRIRFALYTDESTMDLVDKHYKEDGCGCKSEYITKAIQYYAEFHCGLIRVEGEPDAPIFIYHCVFL